MTAPRSEMPRTDVPVRAVTRSPGHCFFGYYDKQQWDPTGRYLLGMRATFEDRSVRPDDLLEIGMVDLQDRDRWIRLAETRAWCWQQGCMLQWLPGTASEVIFNDRDGDRFVSVILDVNTGACRQLPRPVYAVSNDGRHGVSLNFGRLAVTRPGYGYEGVPDILADQDHPAEDGVWLMDLATGHHRLIVSLDRIARHDPAPSMADAVHWFNHLLFTPGGDRFIFLHRWKVPPRHATRMYTVGLDGHELHRCPVGAASHFIWTRDNDILVWDCDPVGPEGYYRFHDRTDDARLVGGDVFSADGHITVSPDERWILTDEYPDARGHRPVLLYRIADGWHCEVARVHSPMPDDEARRCDLHPRWSRDGRQICIDSMHEGTRQIYVLDVSAVLTQGG